MSIILIISCLLLLSTDVYAGNEAVVRLRVYVHDLIGSGSTVTNYKVANSSITSTSATSFGRVNVIDDLLTAEPSINSTAIGRIQGQTTSADLSVSAVAVNLNLYFTAGRFNGSTISILGRNELSLAKRELAVVGGTGVFRFASGYAFQSTYSLDAVAGHGILEYNIYTTINTKLAEISSHHDMEIAQM